MTKSRVSGTKSHLSGVDWSPLAGTLSAGALLTGEAELANYSYDAALDRARPRAVVLARGASDVQKTVRWCAENKVSFTARGAGTNLSGGCIPLRGGIVISLARMDRILQIDTKRGLAVVEPGVVNLNLQKELEKAGFFYAPDPASFKVSTLGGNIAENAGGPRCLKYGTTTNHVLALEAVMPDGSLAKFSLEDDGCELMSLLVGAEGTLGVVTKAWVRILPLPETVSTLLAGFSSIDAAVACVADIIAQGVLPRALEAMDRATVDSVEAYVRAGYPKTEAVLLIELDGPRADVARDAEKVSRLCLKSGAAEVRSATDPVQRDKLWEGRRGAYAALARLAPNVAVEDGVVPRDKLPEIVRRIREISARHRVKAALLFHAGDGNIHPNIAFDERDAEETSRVKAAGHEILQACVELGGSISGEHGIGLDKREAMGWLFSAETLALFRRVKRAIDPDDLANPEKMFPLEGGRGGLSYLQRPSRPLGAQARHLVEKARDCAAFERKMAIRGSGSRLKREALPKETLLLTTGMNAVVDLDRPNCTVTAEAGISMLELHQELRAQGLFLRLPNEGGTLGGLLAAGRTAALRNDLLGMRLLLADGSVAELGGKVVKNVAGYDIPRLVLGSWGAFGVVLEATFKVYSTAAPLEPLEAKPFGAGPWHRRLKDAFDPRNLLNPWFFA